MEVLLRHAEGYGPLPAEGKRLHYVSQQPLSLFVSPGQAQDRKRSELIGRQPVFLSALIPERQFLTSPPTAAFIFNFRALIKISELVRPALHTATQK